MKLRLGILLFTLFLPILVRAQLVSASGGIPYDPCYLLTSTNLAAPVSDWSCIVTNYFDSTGATIFTNAIPADQTQQYFRLQVN